MNMDFDFFLSISTVPIYWTDTRLIIQGCNDACLKLFGMTRHSDCLRKTFEDTPLGQQNQDQIKVWKGLFEKTIQYKKIHLTRERLILSDASLMHCLVHRIPMVKDQVVWGVLCILIDITEQKNTEIQEINLQKEKNKMLQYIIAHLPQHVYWKDCHGVYLGSNDAQALSLGFCSADDIIGKTDFDLPWATGMAELFRSNDLEVMETCLPRMTEEPAIIDGKMGVVLSHKIPMRDHQGRVTGVLGISFDMTEQKRLEKEMNQSKKRLERLNQAKNDFIANLSHDIKTPLSGIISIAECLLLDRSCSKQIAQIQDMIKAGHQLISFFDHCIEMSRLEQNIEESSHDLIPFSQMVNDLVVMLSPNARSKNLLIHVDVDSKIPSLLLGNKPMIERVILNLLSNAIKFTHKGSVTIKSTLVKELSSADIATVRLSIKDTGIGISEKDHDVIFEKFYKVNPSYEGIHEGKGMGLFIVKKFVELLSGTIAVKSNKRRGSEFVMTLPLRIPDQSCRESHLSQAANQLMKNETELLTPSDISKYKKSVSSEFDSKKTCRILLVEDNQMISRAMSTLFTNLDCEVRIAHNGSKAVQQFKTKFYDMVIIDIGLPDMSGFDVAKAIKKKETRAKKKTIIFGISAHVSDSDRMLGLDSGIYKIWSKPLTHQMTQELVHLFRSGVL